MKHVSASPTGVEDASEATYASNATSFLPVVGKCSSTASTLFASTSFAGRMKPCYSYSVKAPLEGVVAVTSPSSMWSRNTSTPFT